MLTYLSVKNFAIIENIEVEFNKGMTALTGETGAGKSLLIDAIGLLLGDRATSNVVRTGSSKAIVEGIFTYNNPKIDQLLETLDIYSENNELIIKRQISTQNSNIVKVNNQSVTLKDLNILTSMLADIHTQEETLRLINPSTYLDIIDGFTSDEIEDALNRYGFFLEKYKMELKEFKRLENSNNDLLERLDLMRFQVKEIESFHLNIGEEETLEDEVEKMNNFDKIYQILNESKQMIDNNEAVDIFYDVAKNLSNLKDISEAYKVLQSRFESSYYELLDVYETLTDEVNTMDFDPNLLDAHQTRLNQLDNLKRKYRKSIPEIIEYYNQIKKDINNIDNFDEVLKQQRLNVQNAFKKTVEMANTITKIRKKTAKYIEKEIIEILSDLELSKTNFEIVFQTPQLKDYLNQTVFTERGIDEVEFMISTNVGEPTKPLSKTASGGEMSRIMLGFKNLLSKSLGLSLMIFDEIDSGVSGFVANQVAKKMKQIATTTQVICITHIPQVAALCDHHMHISKTVKDQRTQANIKLLNKQERIKEIAQMISGDVITDAALESAKNLLK